MNLREQFRLDWRTSYYILQPWSLIPEIARKVKWVWQRGCRGYADCDVWSLDSYLAEWMPQALAQLRRSYHGHPVGLAPERWEKVLKGIQVGFEAAKICIDPYDVIPLDKGNVKEYLQKWNEYDAKRKKGFALFTKYFYSLWD